MRYSRDFSNLLDIQKKVLYMNCVRPMLNKRALFSDRTKDYCDPVEPMPGDEVTIRFRTYRYNVDKVFLHYNGKCVEMYRSDRDLTYDYYKVKITVSDVKIRYYFRVICGPRTCYYNQWGAISELNEAYDFEIIPGFKTPDWMKGAVVYQIYIDRFCNGDESNDVLDNEYVYIGQPVSRVTDWDSLPQAMDIRRFYGGDLAGVYKKLDYLMDLGVEVIYFNPLFVSPSNHKYDIADYDYIDPHIGVIVEDADPSKGSVYAQRVSSIKNLEASNQFFIKLVEEIHKRGMKVIIDGVFNHCGSFNKWLDREHIYEGKEGFAPGAYISKDSPYRNYFDFKDTRDCAWPNNNSYDGWWGHDTLPKLNYEGSEELTNYVLSIGKKWVSPPYNVDGWRLDVAADLGHSSEFNHHFWQMFREAVKSANKDAVILAEHYGNPGSWLQGDEWDTIMNYDAFMEPVTWFLTGMEKHSDNRNDGLFGNGRSFFDSMKHNMANMGWNPTYIALNQLSNHDHSRFLTRTNRRVGRVGSLGSAAAGECINYGIFKEAVVIMMTWPGAPGIYYGDEAGVVGFTDPDNRRTYPWGHEDRELIEFHKSIISLHKDNPVLRNGSLKELVCDYNLISYARFDREHVIIVVINNNDDEKHVKIPVWQAGVNMNDYMEQIFLSTSREHSTSVIGYSVRAGFLDVHMRGYSATIYRLAR